MQLFCFPFAGGNSWSYRGLAQALPQFNVTGIELAGRGRRSAEPPAKDFATLADDATSQIAKAIAQNPSVPYAFYGHSMGSCLAYLVTNNLLAQGAPAPRALFISGRNSPTHPEKKEYHLLPRSAFLDLLGNLGGCPPEILQDAELMELFEPILRADFQAHSTYEYQPAPPIKIPLTIFTGTDDPHVNPAGLAAWSEITTHTPEQFELPGGHFFLFQQWPTIAARISERL